ncbi:MAG TPA: hypothetical protein PLU88_11410 [Armatimonadota bacterium]|nr:hypothetical protein [Armatimonadota bacterium]
MAVFRPFEMKGRPLDDQVMSWNDMVKAPYDKNNVDTFTRTRVILMNGIENASVLMSHCLSRMIDNDEIKRQLSFIRRLDSLQQQTVNWLHPANQSVTETTIGYEQLAVDLTANLAQNEPDGYFKQVLDFALLEDFDHLFRYGCLLELLEGKDPNNITQGKTMIKEGRPTKFHHRHPCDEMRKHFDGQAASLKSKMNNLTIVAAEQQTELFYKSHGFMYQNDLARKLYFEIADIEEQHVTQYELVGDPSESPLEKMCMIQLCEAYNYYSCAETEPDSRIKSIWMQFAEDEIQHFMVMNGLLQQFEGRDIRDVMKTDTIEPLIVLQENKDYVQQVLDTQVQLQPFIVSAVPLETEWRSYQDLPSDWPSFGWRDKQNADGVPSDQVVERARKEAMIPQAV